MKSDDRTATVAEDRTTTVDKRGRRVRAMFAGVARHYDLLNHLLSLNIDRRWRCFTVRTVPPEPGVPILDVCTGTGDLALAYAATLRANGDETVVLGADFCHEMLRLARAKSQRYQLPVEILEADAQRLPFEDGRFGIVTNAFGLRNVADTRQGIAEMVRVARRGGRVAILEFSRPRVQPLRWIYFAYFRHLLPRIGQWISGSEHDAYHYLPASVLEFPDGEQMLGLMREMGLSEVKLYPLTFGIATLYVGRKGTETEKAEG